jgi:hypothetical protein
MRLALLEEAMYTQTRHNGKVIKYWDEKICRQQNGDRTV